MEKDEHAQRLFFAHGRTHNSLFKCDNKVPIIALLEGAGAGPDVTAPTQKREIACIQKEQTHDDNPHTYTEKPVPFRKAHKLTKQ